MRTLWIASGTALAAAVLLVGERDAQACGGCFVPTESESVITDHRMVLSISSKETTLYDQIRYSGNPASFAWVLPISGVATVGLSSDTVFGVLDGMTATSVQPPPQNCPARPADCAQTKNASPPSAGGADFADAAGPVTVTKQETVGPFETVQLHSTDAQALNTWLATNGFAVPADVQPIITKYVNEHFDFLALKLKPGAGVTSMRPVRVTTAGASPVLPLRMVAAGTGALVGVTLWVVGEGRYEPQNFPFFQIGAEEISWDWQASASDYKTLRATREAALGGRGWEIESSMDLSKDTIGDNVKYGYLGGRFGGVGPSFGPDAGPDYLPVQNDAGVVTETSDQVRDDDLKALIGNIPTSLARVTRVRSDLNHAALTTDLALQASKDQSPLQGLRIAKLEKGQPNCPIYQGCEVVGNAPRDEAIAQSNANAAKRGSSSCSAGVVLGGAPLGLLAAAGFVGLAALWARRRRR